MAREYHFTPQQVGEMTLYQIRVLMADEKEVLSGNIKFGSMGAQRRYGKLRSDKTRWTDFMAKYLGIKIWR